MGPKRQGRERGGGHERQQRTITVMYNQLTPSDHTKTAHHGRQTSLGCQDDNDNNQHTAEDEVNDLDMIAVAFTSAEKGERDSPRPSPPPEPPQPPSRRPWPGNKIFTLANSNGMAHEAIFQIKGPVRGIQSFPWQGQTPTRIKTIPDKRMSAPHRSRLHQLSLPQCRHGDK